MPVKIPKCPNGRTHKWEWRFDTTVRSLSGRTVGAYLTVTRFGVYKCACGAQKYGAPHSGL